MATGYVIWLSDKNSHFSKIKEDFLKQKYSKINLCYGQCNDSIYAMGWVFILFLLNIFKSSTLILTCCKIANKSWLKKVPNTKILQIKSNN